MSAGTPPPDNPYQSPPAEAIIDAEPFGGLSRRQRKTLQFYLKYREQPPTVFGLVAMSATRWLVLLVLCGMAGACILGITFILDVSLTAALFTIGLMLGLGLGATARDAGIFRNFVHVWPILHDVLNWRRIEQRLSEDG